MQYTQHFNTKQTPQSEPAFGKAQTQNSAGGFVFEVDQWTRLNRFLILGSEGGSYYATERELTQDNAKTVIKCIQDDGFKVLSAILDVSENGKAPKNDAAIFALALCATFGSSAVKSLSYTAIPRVCRIGTHLFQFCEAIQKLRGWSAGLRKGVSSFYLKREPGQIAYQAIKYQNRNGWCHRDVLRLAHPKAKNAEMNRLLGYIVGKKEAELVKLDLISAFEEIKHTKRASRAVQLILAHDLPREVVPTELLNQPSVWDALLHKMPITALIRNLGKMTEVGLLKSGLCESTKTIVATLTNSDILKRARIHPMTLLMAHKTYASGHGLKGSLTWSPVSRLVDTLEQAFYASFAFVEPTHLNYLLGLDISGSMGSTWAGNTGITAKEAAAVLAMVTARTEENHEFIAFDHGVKRLNISANDRLDAVMAKTNGWTGGATDCALPMLHAIQHKLPVDVFAVYTDSETWHGQIHPFQALQSYRNKTGRKAKLIVLGMVANEFTIADPSDPYMLDIVGFDTSVPEVMAGFARS